MNHRTVLKLVLLALLSISGLSIGIPEVSADSDLIVRSQQDAFVRSGEIFEMTIGIEQAQDIIGYQMRLNYDNEFFEIHSVERAPNLVGDLYEDIDQDTGVLTINFLQVNERISGNEDLIVVFFLVSEDFKGEGEQSVFELDDDYVNQFLYQPQGSHEVQIVDDEDVDYDFTSKVTYGIYGDLDGDDSVSVYDMVSLELHLANEIVLQPTQQLLADVNLDGELDDDDLDDTRQFITESKDYLGTTPLHVVSYVTNNDETIPDSILEYGETLDAPEALTKTGYEFIGWYEDDSFETEITFPLTISHSTTLYAKWEINEYTISFEANGGSAVGEIKAEYDSEIDEPEPPVREGHTFGGWYTDDGVFEEAFVFDLMPADNLTLYAKWEINEYTISFEANGGSAVGEIKAEYDSEIDEPEPPVREGHTFGGWYTDDGVFEEAFVFDVMPAYNETLYAKWVPRDYVIAFNTNEGTPLSPITVTFGDPIELPETTREYYTFEGWYEDEELTVPFDYENMPAESFGLHADWEIITYTISVELDGGTGVESFEQDHGTDVDELDDPTKTGQTFAGWYADEQFETAVSFPFTAFEDQTLYAKWVTQIDFDSNGGSPCEPIVQDPGTELELPEPNLEGYAFEGWHQEGDIPFTSDVMPLESIELYALWSIMTYQVTYEQNNGEGPIIESKQYGETLDLEPEREGFIFSGWYTSDDFDERIYTVPDQDIVVHTFWQYEQLVLLPVGDAETYTIPKNTDDDDTDDVVGGYSIAQTETTYELWFDVRSWAEENDYHFENGGREGSHGTVGEQPTENGKHEPVTSISWRDAIVWTNALSEMTGFNPVYRTPQGEVIRDARDENAGIVDGAIRTEHNGFRLPTDSEWEMAARWTDDSDDTNGSILRGGRYWTPGHYASGADDDSKEEVERVGWFYQSSKYESGETKKTRDVMSLDGNDLGLFDMSGNVSEWNGDRSPVYPGIKRIIRGGSYYQASGFLEVGQIDSHYSDYTSTSIGFRVVRQGAPQVHTVQFISDGTTLSTSIINHGDEAIPPAEPEKEGYVFDGWDQDFDHVTEDLIIHAIFVEEEEEE
ncbi:MAG: InlB B-repeat-containing protein [Acholeplasmataceae bacterium]